VNTENIDFLTAF